MSAGGRHVVSVGAVERFLSGRRIAVVGVGSSASSFGRAIYDALLDHGYEALAVNRSTSLSDVAPVDGVMIVIKDPETVLSVIDEAAGLGVARVWLFKGLGGPGALSDAAVSRCRALGLDVVEGACPLMFLAPVRGGHRFHGWVRRARGAVAA